MSGVGGLLELYWDFIGVDRNFIGTVPRVATLLLRYCYVIATLLVSYRYVIGGRSGLDRGCPIYGAPPSGSRFWTLFQDHFLLGYHAASRSPRKRTPAGAGVLLLVFLIVIVAASEVRCF